jgi:hypothetical protein
MFAYLFIALTLTGYYSTYAVSLSFSNYSTTLIVSESVYNGMAKLKIDGNLFNYSTSFKTNSTYPTIFFLPSNPTNLSIKFLNLSFSLNINRSYSVKVNYSNNVVDGSNVTISSRVNTIELKGYAIVLPNGMIKYLILKGDGILIEANLIDSNVPVNNSISPQEIPPYIYISSSLILGGIIGYLISRIYKRRGVKEGESKGEEKRQPHWVDML